MRLFLDEFWIKFLFIKIFCGPIFNLRTVIGAKNDFAGKEVFCLQRCLRLNHCDMLTAMATPMFLFTKMDSKYQYVMSKSIPFCNLSLTLATGCDFLKQKKHIQLIDLWFLHNSSIQNSNMKSVLMYPIPARPNHKTFSNMPTLYVFIIMPTHIFENFQPHPIFQWKPENM